MADRFDDKTEIGVTRFLSMAQVRHRQTPAALPKVKKDPYQTKYLDVRTLANSLYFTVAKGSKLPNINITEVNLSGIPNELKQTHLKWEEKKDPSRKAQLAVYPIFLNPEDKFGFSGIALQPQ